MKTLLLPLFLATIVSVAGFAQPIDREALVRRHNVHVTSVDPEAAVSVGNGEFAFTVDVTGLQTFEQLYYDEGLPLETLSTWAWHSFPNTENLTLADAMEPYPFHGRTVRYPSLQDSPAGAYFRENPHPVALGQISLVYDGHTVTPDDLTEIDQSLDLWTGVIRSRYTIAGQPVEVETVAHSEHSAVAVKLRSPLITDGALQVRWRFPYAYQTTVKNKPPFIWDQPDAHSTLPIHRTPHSVTLRRAVDDTTYFVNVRWEDNASFTEGGPHDFRLASSESDTLTFVCNFAPEAQTSPVPAFDETRSASVKAWHDYWTSGGVIDFSGSTDPRAAELERRMVLSQYLVKVHYAGSVPPAETGLAHVTWYGKHNSEMYFWHAAQFYAWGHTELLEKGLAWYQKILPRGKADAAAKGFEGVRWPKMAGIDGRPGPGTINPFIIWNQPNPIYLCELVHRAKPGRATLEKYREIVFESAKFLASFAHYDEATDRYVLGPPIKNVSESVEENNTQNPTFELAYWYYALRLAQEWRERLGLEPDPRWADVIAKLSSLPVKDGLYLEIETIDDIYEDRGGVPVSMLMALGFLPQTDKVDPEIIRRTFGEVNRRSRRGLERWVSWSIGQGTLTATRLGDQETAVTIATNPAARFMPSGHVRRPAEPDACVAYLPVNSSLLLAVAVMAAGWDDAPDVHAPGFPQDGSWQVRWEGLNRMP